MFINKRTTKTNDRRSALQIPRKREKGKKKKTNVITVGIQDTLAHKAHKLVWQNLDHSWALHSQA